MSVSWFWPDWNAASEDSGFPWEQCSDPPAESCSDAACPVHGADDPPEVDPEDAEAQRAAETFADAADEYAAIEAGDLP